MKKFIPLVFLLSGCQSAVDVIKEVDYGCVDISLDEPATESEVAGRGVIVPDGVILTQELIDGICNY